MANISLFRQDGHLYYRITWNCGHGRKQVRINHQHKEWIDKNINRLENLLEHLEQMFREKKEISTEAQKEWDDMPMFILEAIEKLREPVRLREPLEEATPKKSSGKESKKIEKPQEKLVYELSQQPKNLPVKDSPYSSRIASIFDEVRDLVLAKNADYGNSIFDPPVMSPSLPPETSIIVRMSDKIKRIIQLTNHPTQVKKESLEDTLKDLMGYAALWLVLLKKE